MKRYIIITALLAATLGINAQRTTTSTRTTSTSTRSADEEKKSNSVNTETRTREAAPQRQNTTNETRTSTPEKRSEPVYNESRNRETPSVRPTSNTRATEAQAPERKVEPRPANTQREVEQERKVGGSGTNGNTQNGSRPASQQDRKVNGTTGNTQNGSRPSGSREVSADRNREYVPRTEPSYVEKRQAYRTPERPRTVRTVNTHTNYVYHPVEYRRSYYPYSEPRRVDIIWDYNMYHEYRYLYPHYDYWYYPIGYRIQTISAYEAGRMIGEVARIYGRVSEVWYERKTDEYTLYFGAPYPYQDFSVILPGKFARRYSHRPERYFAERSVVVTGLVSLWDERPEMLIKKRSQIEIYL